MHFWQGHIYHIYNQGNNRQRIFFERDNYLFFLRKMREYLLPYCDVVAYCLMPNHFHWMVEVKAVAVVKAVEIGGTERMTQSHPLSGRTPANFKEVSLNDSISVLLRSYTRAINIQQKRSGSLFRPKTKAECLTARNGVSPSFFRREFGTHVNTHRQEEEYLQICFDYIHRNPVVAGLVGVAEDWEFSSFRDYKGLRNGTLIDKDKAKRIGICS